MRCLSLARALSSQGVECRFVCREHEGNLLAHIRAAGFDAIGLPRGSGQKEPDALAHAAWLGADWRTDAAQTVAALGGQRARYLVVDHYALDRRWEDVLRPACDRLLVIDDLADRPHACDFLLDQNLGRTEADYANLVQDHCRVMAGPTYALLRPGFAVWRDQSLQRRAVARLEHVLVSMGGVDKDNVTGAVLDALRHARLPERCRITVVMGPHAPWIEAVRAEASSLPWVTEVKVGVPDMEQLMADSDLSVGAAGSTSWERCCMGLPALMLVLAENQRAAAEFLERVGAAWKVDDAGALLKDLPAHIDNFIRMPESLLEMSRCAAAVCDGRGLDRVIDIVQEGLCCG